jgi:glycosyltransferase involved in cell wall biosynthesis
MKLCMVTHKVIKGDGQGRVNYEVALEAIRRGYHLTLLASSISPDLLQNSLVEWVPIVVKGLPTELLKNLVFSQKSAAWLQQHRAEFDLIKVNGAITSAPADVNAVHFLHSTWLQSPVHPAQQSRNYYGAYQWFYTRLNAYWEKQSFDRAQAIIAVSAQVKHQLIALGVPVQKIHVILNGVDLQEFFPGAGDRQSWELPEGVPLALFVGDIRSNRKNLDTVLKALIHVPDLHLAIVGELAGSPYPGIAANLGIDCRVHFLGFQQQISAIMRAVDFLVFPSRYETFGMVVTEAMASGLPIIIGNNVGAAELITTACGEVLSDVEDAMSLAKSLHKLASNRDRRQQMGQAARTIASDHAWSSKAQSYLNLFELMAEPSILN